MFDKRWVRTTEEQLATLKAALEVKPNLAEAARKAGLSRPTAQYWATKWGLNRRAQEARAQAQGAANDASAATPQAKNEG